MTTSELIQGVVARVLIVGTPLVVLVFMVFADVDIIDVRGWPVPVLSLFAIPGIMYFLADRFGFDHPAFQWVQLIALPAVAMTQWDRIPLPFTDDSVRALALLGVLAIQYRPALWLLRFYQEQQAKAEDRIKIKVDDILDRGGVDR